MPMAHLIRDYALYRSNIPDCGVLFIGRALAVATNRREGIIAFVYILANE